MAVLLFGMHFSAVFCMLTMYAVLLKQMWFPGPVT